MLLCQCAACDSKNIKFIKQQASGLLSSLGIKTLLNKCLNKSIQEVK